MRVLQVLPTLSAGGAEGFVAALASGLSRAGVDCKVFLTGGVRGERGQVLFDQLMRSGVEVIGQEERRVRSLGNIARLISVVRRFRPNIVQANLYSSEVVAAAGLSLAGRRDVRLMRRLANTKLSSVPGGRLARRLFSRRFDAVIACSDAVAESYRAACAPDNPGNLYTIPNGCMVPDMECGIPTVRDARRALGLPESGFGIVHIGRMAGGRDGSLASGQKAHDVIIRAFARMVREGSADAFLILVGDGPLRPAVAALATSLGVHDRVHFVGVQREPWLPLAAADIFFFPSRHEGIPNALLEAACLGLPVVASEIEEILSLGNHQSWLLRPVNDVDSFADALGRARVEIASLREAASRAAVAFRQRYSMDACVRKYIAAYSEWL